MGSKLVQGEDGKNGQVTGSFAGDRGAESSQPGRACSEEPVVQESQARKVQSKGEHHGARRLKATRNELLSTGSMVLPF